MVRADDVEVSQAAAAMCGLIVMPAAAAANVRDDAKSEQISTTSASIASFRRLSYGMLGIAVCSAR